MRHPSILPICRLILDVLAISLLFLLELFYPRLLHIVHGLCIFVHCLNKLAEVADSQLLKIDGTALSHLDEHFLKLLVLFTELTDHALLRAFINDSLVLDLLGSIRIAEGRQGFLIVHRGRRERADHDGLGVATKSILQDSSQI